MRYLTDAEARVLRAKVGEQQSPKIAVALHTVMRRGHLFALRWSDVDFETGVITAFTQG